MDDAQRAEPGEHRHGMRGWRLDYETEEQIEWAFRFKDLILSASFVKDGEDPPGVSP
jgi:hypothetical protein